MLNDKIFIVKSYITPRCHLECDSSSFNNPNCPATQILGPDCKISSTYLLNELNVSLDKGILHKSSWLKLINHLQDYAAIGLNPASQNCKKMETSVESTQRPLWLVRNFHCLPLANGFPGLGGGSLLIDNKSKIHSKINTIKNHNIV